MNKRNYYDILGVSKTATKTELKSAYHKLALQWHPDRNKKPEATVKFKEINEAYEILINPITRQQYDGRASSGYTGGTYQQTQKNTKSQSSTTGSSYTTSNTKNAQSTPPNHSVRNTLFIFLTIWILSSISQTKTNPTPVKSSTNVTTQTPATFDQSAAGNSIIQPNVNNNPSITTKDLKNNSTGTTKPVVVPPPTTEPTIDCVGPDGKHLQVTQKTCDDFNNAWKKPAAQQQNTYDPNNCNNSCPSNSHCSYGSCSCNDGYTKNYNTNLCDACPQNSTGSYGSCTCNNGYSKNYNTGQCDKLNCPSNSHESRSSCLCNDNYVMNYSSGQCDRCPDNSTYGFGSCNCNSGYVKNYSSGQCEKLNCPSNSHESNNSCVCNDNYVKNYSNGQCESCPANSTWSYGYCSCNGGYAKNYSSGQCDKQ